MMFKVQAFDGVGSEILTPYISGENGGRQERHRSRKAIETERTDLEPSANLPKVRSRELPVVLERVRLGLATWREQRRGGERIPKGLWGEVARAARQYGLNRVSKALGLDYKTT